MTPTWVWFSYVPSSHNTFYQLSWIFILLSVGSFLPIVLLDFPRTSNFDSWRGFYFFFPPVLQILTVGETFFSGRFRFNNRYFVLIHKYFRLLLLYFSLITFRTFILYQCFKFLYYPPDLSLKFSQFLFCLIFYLVFFKDPYISIYFYTFYFLLNPLYLLSILLYVSGCLFNFRIFSDRSFLSSRRCYVVSLVVIWRGGVFAFGLLLPQ